MESATAPTATPARDTKLWHTSIFWVAVWAGYFVLWLSPNWAAVTETWWFADDFWMIERRSAGEAGRIYELAYTAGRPMTSVLFVLHKWAMNPAFPEGAIAVRFVQGAAHTLGALCLALFFARFLPRWKAALAATPFLLWGFNAEAVIWFGGIQHVFGALFAIAGWLAITSGLERRRWWLCVIGALVAGLSILCNQNPAAAALMLWLFAFAFMADSPGALHGINAKTLFAGWSKAMPFESAGRTVDRLMAIRPIGIFVRSGWHLFWGLGLAALVSLWLLKKYSYHRAGSDIDWGAKWDFYQQLNHTLFFWPDFYPTGLQVSHGLLLGAVSIGMVVAVIKRSLTFSGLLIWISVLAIGTVLPFLANLLIPMNWPSFRIYYIAPILICALLGLAFRLWAGRWGTLLVTLIAVGIGWHNIWLAAQNAPNYPRLYQQDLATLAYIEEEAEKYKIDTVLVLVGDIAWPWELNAYGIRYYHMDGFRSNFHTPWTPHPFIRIHSQKLKAPGDEFEIKQWGDPYREFARSLPAGPPYFVVVPAPDRPDLLLVVPR